MKKEMLINVLQPEECRIAIVEDGVLEELYVERTSNENYTGNIYKGRIVNLEPAIQAAFVDFSVGRNGFLHVSDVEPQYYSQSEEPEPHHPAPAAPAGDDWERPHQPQPQQVQQPQSRRDRDRDPRERPRDREREPRRGPSAPPAPPAPAPSPAPPASSRMEDSWPVIDRFDPLWEADDEPRGQAPPAFGGHAAPPDEPPQDRPRPPRRRGGDRERGRERPDHMDKRRRPPSSGDSRSFGEGLFEELYGTRGQRPEPEPAWDLPRPAPAEPAPAPAPVQVEPPAPPASQAYSPAPASPPPARERGRDREREREREVAPAESRGRYAPKPFDDDAEAYLPPNRNQRSRVPAPRREPERPVSAPAPAEPEPLEEVSWRPIEPAPVPARSPRAEPVRSPRAEPEARTSLFGEAIDEPPGEDGPSAGDRPRRRRGRRGRGGRPDDQAAPEAAEQFAPVEQPEVDFFAEPSADRLEPAPPFDEEEDFPEAAPPPPRRGGRDAIRARGGDRPMPPAPAPGSHSFGEPSIHRPAPARPNPPRREPPRTRDGGLPERPATAHAHGPAPFPAAPPRDEAPEAGEQAAPRRRPAPRATEPPPTHHRHRPALDHSRPGEPDYVPRSLRDTPAPSGAPPQQLPPYAEIDEDEPEGDVYEAEDLVVGEAAPGGDESDPAKRKRRRRRRRRGDQPEAEARTTPEPRVPEPRGGEARGGRGRARPLDDVADDEDHPEDDFDFAEGVDGVDEEDEIEGVDEGGAVAVSDPDDVIDPELEAEIRREIAEIEELERNMGLRATTEARPRRADAAAGIKARGGIKPPIQDIFRRGDEVLLQVIKESIGTKGPTLSTYISIPGRYLVLMPGLNRVGVSRKIADESQRRKLREIMQELNPPKGLGFIVRTAGMDRSKRELARDMAYLLRLWKTILMRIKRTKGPAPIYQESDLITRTIRDIFSDGIDTIWIDEPAAFERAQEFMRNVMPHFADRVKLYDGKVPLFHKYGLEEEIHKIHRKVVPLAGGGSIVIEQTEALVAIDVNSGNFRVENDAERTAYETNLKAAREIARQLRLRDLGGVIINDFIDMREERHRRGVEKAIRDAVKRDRARTKILRMSQFGIIEMTRQRIRPSLKNSVYEPCPRCQASGLVKTAESMAIDVTRMLMLACHRPEVRRVNITVNPGVALYLNNKKRQEIARLEGIGNVMIYIREAEDAPADHLKMDCYDANNAEVRLFPGAQSSSSSRR